MRRGRLSRFSRQARWNLEAVPYGRVRQMAEAERRFRSGPAGAAGPPLFYDRAVEGSELLSVDGADLGQGFTRNGAQS
jgi:hypothetical protein